MGLWRLKPTKKTFVHVTAIQLKPICTTESCCSCSPCFDGAGFKAKPGSITHIGSSSLNKPSAHWLPRMITEQFSYSDNQTGDMFFATMCKRSQSLNICSSHPQKKGSFFSWECIKSLARQEDLKWPTLTSRVYWQTCPLLQDLQCHSKTHCFQFIKMICFHENLIRWGHKEILLVMSRLKHNIPR